jgi:enediyne biosynthesis protein E4
MILFNCRLNRFLTPIRGLSPTAFHMANCIPHARHQRSLQFISLGLTFAFAFCPVVIAGDRLLKQEEFARRSGPRGATMFAALDANVTGIKTENRYADPQMWGSLHQEFEVGAMGTGVAIGDYDNDGRADVFVVSKTESCRLFRNLGEWKFADVTEEAGVADRGDAARIWKQGATFADVNNDGSLDLYVCRFNAPNLLYINQRNGTFREEAVARGLGLKDASVVGAFADYDGDGWLDVFVLTNILDHLTRPAGQRSYLFRNRGDGTFQDVTSSAGIQAEGQGHSATWWDFDQDGRPDLYIAYDFARPDQLYRNNGDGTFANVIDRVVPHQPYSSMGADLGDVNNDGWVDFLVADMAATSAEKDQRAMAASRANMAQEPADGSPEAPQVLRNALYLNTGTGRMLEAACLAGVAATDWTWSVRWEDLDHDRWLDLHVTNGMHRESHNVDLLSRVMTAPSPAERIRVRRSSPVLAEANLAFRSVGRRSDTVRLEEVGKEWGLNEVGVSFGAAFGDLDNDGDLDLVYSNFEKGVTVLRNDTDGGNAVIVALRTADLNRFGVGAKVQIETAAGIQTRTLTIARGYLSSSEPVLHFGLGAEQTVQRLRVTWPNGVTQSYENLRANQKYTIEQSAAPAHVTHDHSVSKRLTLFAEVGSAIGVSAVMTEAVVDERRQNPLLPMRLNRRGPALASGDIDGDGDDDLVVGGTSQESLRILLQDADGRYAGSSGAGIPPTAVNDGPVLVFDADGNGTNDLLVTKSGAALPAGSSGYQSKLYLNDGKADFREAPSGTLPAMPWSVGAVSAADFDRDGRLDLFIGGRIVPGAYPAIPHSALLRNVGGRFEDLTDALAPALKTIGMVSAALWSDWDNDGWVDLVVACEWGRVSVFRNRGGTAFEDVTEKSGFGGGGTGWWTSLAAGDFNNDGRTDYIAGNVGTNTPYRASPEYPALLYAGDFRGDDTEHLIEAYHDGARIVPWRTRKELAAVLPAIGRKFPKNDDFARASLVEIVGREKLEKATRLAATELRSCVFLSDGAVGHRVQPLPQMAQIAPLYGIAVADFDGDGNQDAYAVQNSHAPSPVMGRFDGGLSQLLRGDGHGGFIAVPARESGLVVSGDAKALVMTDLLADGWPDLVVSRNNATALAFRHSGGGSSQPIFVRLKGRVGNLDAVGARMLFEFADATKQVSEVHAGAGYFSQSSAGVFIASPEQNKLRRVTVRWPWGETTQHTLPEGQAHVVISSDPR